MTWCGLFHRRFWRTVFVLYATSLGNLPVLHTTCTRCGTDWVR